MPNAQGICKIDHAGEDEIAASIIIPTFNGSKRIGRCLDALRPQIVDGGVEILVVDDGSVDETSAVVSAYHEVRLISQRNSGPASARNHGATESRGKVLLFTDDDCVPNPDWVTAMLGPFAQSEIVGAKGAYRTHQRSLVARFVQLEYESKYRFMSANDDIDFIDTYSGAYRRDNFLAMGGYDTSFPVACAEDIELSYRISALGWKMRFVPQAIVYHTHPAQFIGYLKKKYKFAFWRMLALRKNPQKAVRDSHTPQLMKLQVLFLPLMLVCAAIDIEAHPRIPASFVLAFSFFLSTLPFVTRSLSKDPLVALLSPLLLAARACAQFVGVTAGFLYARRTPAAMTTDVAQ